MTSARAPSWWWGALIAGGGVAALSPSPAPLVFAGAAVALLGLPHGAGDLAVVSPDRRPGFLLAYVLAIAAVLGLWLAVPLLTLVGLLALSAAHFAMDGREADGRAGGAAGLLLVAGPALLHRNDVATLFVAATRQPAAAALLATALQAVAVAALVGLGWLAARPGAARSASGDLMRLAVGLAATIAPPPLIGFALGFVLLHAAPQTRVRQRELGCATMRAYLALVAPVLVGAGLTVALAAALLARAAVTDDGVLFATIAALAVPHMLVTPLWRRAPQGRPALA